MWQNILHFIGGQVHAMEVGQQLVALHILCDELEFAERSFSIFQFVLQICQRHFEHAVFETIGSYSCTLRTVDQRFADLAIAEHTRRFDVVPILSRKWIDHLLLVSFFGAFRETFILTDSHDASTMLI